MGHKSLLLLIKWLSTADFKRSLALKLKVQTSPPGQTNPPSGIIAGVQKPMLTSLKTSSRKGLRQRSLWNRATSWWSTMSETEQRMTLARGIAVSACAVTAAVAIPTLSGRVETESLRAEFRADAQFLAERIETRAPVQSDADAAVLSTPWMRTVEYALKYKKKKKKKKKNLNKKKKKKKKKKS